MIKLFKGRGRKSLRRRRQTTGNIEALLERALRDVLTICCESDSDTELREKLTASGWRTTRNPSILCHYGYSDDYRICFDVQQLRLKLRSPVFASHKKMISKTVSLPESTWRSLLAEYGL